MYGEMPFRFKYMINNIVNCLIQNIMSNLNNNLLIETKLLLINNYIIDTFNASEKSRNTKINFNSNKNHESKNNNDKSNKIISPIFDNNATFSKLSKVFIHFEHTKLKEYIKENNNEYNNIKFFPDKDKFKIMSLKNLLQSEQEKNKMRELSNIKRLDQLNFYEAEKFVKKKLNHSLNINDKNKNNAFKVKEEKKMNSNMNNSTINNIKINNKDYFSLINTFLNKKTNFFYPNTTRILKHSMSQRKIFRNNNKTKI